MTQLAKFLHLPPDWDAHSHGVDLIVLTGPGGRTATLENRKSDFLPHQWREAAARAILDCMTPPPPGTVPLASFLSLPDGWTAMAFPTTIELRGPAGERATIPAPAAPTARSIIITQALAACQTATKS